MKLYEKIIDRIKDDISEGKYKRGDKIPSEGELMKLYAVGRSTIREAIKTLATSGILKVQQGAGTFVNHRLENVSIEQRLIGGDFKEVKAVRKILENEIIKLAILNHTEEQLSEIEYELAKRKAAIQAGQQQDCADADIAFHIAIAHAAGNTVLAELYASFTLIMRNFFSARDNQNITHFAMNHHLHEELFKAIKSKRTNQALGLLQKILDDDY